MATTSSQSDTRVPRLGRTTERSLSPAVWVLVERGCERHPDLAATLQGDFEVRPREDFAPARIRFTRKEILVEDGPGPDPDLVLEGSLGDVLALLNVPLLKGWPSPASGAGRRALGWLASGRLRLDGPTGLARHFLGLMHLEH